MIGDDFTPKSYINAAIFSGPEGTGKLTQALKIAINLTDYGWQNIKLYTTRNVNVMLKNAYDMYQKRLDNDSQAYFLKYADVALLRYRTSDEKKRGEIDDFDKVLQAMDALHFASKSLDENKKCVELIYKSLAALKYGTTITVDDIRDSSSFLEKTDPTSKPKILILENLEKQNASVSNSLLKLLEEPPRDSVILIISQNSKNLLPTIRSRARIYYFEKNAGEYKARDVQEEELQTLANMFVTLLKGEKQPGLSAGIGAAFSKKAKETLSSKEKGVLLVKMISAGLQKLFRQAEITKHDAQYYQNRLNLINTQIAVYNLSPTTVLEPLILECVTRIQSR